MKGINKFTRKKRKTILKTMHVDYFRISDQKKKAHRSWRGVLDTTLCDQVCHLLATGQWFFPCTLVSSTNKTKCC